jgi:hypothetical protein
VGRGQHALDHRLDHRWPARPDIEHEINEIVRRKQPVVGSDQLLERGQRLIGGTPEAGRQDMGDGAPDGY